MVDWRLRLRTVLSTQFTLILGVLVVLALAGGWMTYSAYADPDPPTDQQKVESWETTSAFDHSATVVQDSAVFSQGTTLTDRPVYFTRLSPELNGTFQTVYDASDGGQLDQTVSLSLVTREVDERGQGEEAVVHWETSEELTRETFESVESGERLTVSFARNMSAVETETNRIQDELGGTTGETEVFVHATVRSEGTIHGETVNETSQHRLPVTFEETTYSVSDAGPTTDEYDISQSAAVDETADETGGSLGGVGGPLLLVVSLGLLVGLVTVGKPEPLSEDDRAAVAYERDRETFDEWISTITLPPDAFELPQAEAASLGELVDLAIDTDNRVIADPDDGGYYVPHDGYLYCYRPAFETTSLDGPTAQNTDSSTSETESTEASTDADSDETTPQ